MKCCLRTCLSLIVEGLSARQIKDWLNLIEQEDGFELTELSLEWRIMNTIIHILSSEWTSENLDHVLSLINHVFIATNNVCHLRKGTFVQGIGYFWCICNFTFINVETIWYYDFLNSCHCFGVCLSPYNDFTSLQTFCSFHGITNLWVVSYKSVLIYHSFERQFSHLFDGFWDLLREQCLWAVLLKLLLVAG